MLMNRHIVFFIFLYVHTRYICGNVVLSAFVSGVRLEHGRPRAVFPQSNGTVSLCVVRVLSSREHIAFLLGIVSKGWM